MDANVVETYADLVPHHIRHMVQYLNNDVSWAVFTAIADNSPISHPDLLQKLHVKPNDYDTELQPVLRNLAASGVIARYATQFEDIGIVERSHYRLTPVGKSLLTMLFKTVLPQPKSNGATKIDEKTDIVDTVSHRCDTLADIVWCIETIRNQNGIGTQCTIDDIYVTEDVPSATVHVVIGDRELTIAATAFGESVAEGILHMPVDISFAPYAINSLCMLRFDELKRKVLTYYADHQTANGIYPSDVADALDLDLRLTYQLVRELIHDGRIATVEQPPSPEGHA